jgi:CIC family chloride channel protein
MTGRLRGRSGWLALVGRSVAGGAGIGILGGGFRRLLLWAYSTRIELVRAAHGPWYGLLAVCASVTVAAVLARLIVRASPESAGSGIQLVEATWRDDRPTSPWSVIPAKLVGGFLAIGAGLALGREGPTVHMGSILGARITRATGGTDDDERLSYVAMGGAGLAVAFSAPLGGMLFTLEEVAHRLNLRLLVAGTIGSFTAVSISRLILPPSPIFVVHRLGTHVFIALAFCAAFGALVGAVGSLYNRLLLALIDHAARLRRWPPEVWAGTVGFIVGLMTFVWPNLTGGGDELSARILLGGLALLPLVGLLIGRVILGPLSYSAGTPGGIFAPLLVVGALVGATCQQLLGSAGTWTGTDTAGLALVGMAALFAASVRAPFTGVVLVAEMSATTQILLPMLVASLVAAVVARRLGSAPIYDSLRARAAAAAPRTTAVDPTRPTHGDDTP